jgi:putative serine protease PepD
MEHSEAEGPTSGDDEEQPTAPPTDAPPESLPTMETRTPTEVVTSGGAVALGPASDGSATPASDDPTEEVTVVGSGDTAQIPAMETAASAPFLPPQWQEPVPEAAAGDAVRPPSMVMVPSGPSSWSPDLSPPPAKVSTESNGRRSPGWVWAVVSVAAALVGAVIGGGIVAASNHGSSTTVKEISAGPALLNGTTNIETVIAKVLPAVVSIDATSPAPATQSIFGGTSGGGVQEDQGTGMIITPNGEVITNNHVIAGATTITVTLFGSLKALPATLVDTDPANDVALLQISNASNLPTVTYGNSDNVQVGDAVVAIGNALGLSAGTPTVTQGIISAKGRTVQASDSSGNATETLTNMFQTDAAINPGNSGGPLVDSSGKVIGMNTAVAASANGTSQAQNIGFAIPSDKIGQLLPALRSKSIGNQTQSGTAFLGVSLETLTPQLRSAYNFVPSQGAVVLQVEDGSPAAVAGLQQGDVITSFQGKPVTSADQLATAIQDLHPGKKVSIGLYRGQSQMTVTATLGTNAGTSTSSFGS